MFRPVREHLAPTERKGFFGCWCYKYSVPPGLKTEATDHAHLFRGLWIQGHSPHNDQLFLQLDVRRRTPNHELCRSTFDDKLMPRHVPIGELFAL